MVRPTVLRRSKQKGRWFRHSNTGAPASPRSPPSDFLLSAKRRHFRRLAARILVSGEESRTSRTEGRESRGESLFDDLSISEIWEWASLRSAESGSNSRPWTIDCRTAWASPSVRCTGHVVASAPMQGFAQSRRRFQLGGTKPIVSLKRRYRWPRLSLSPNRRETASGPGGSDGRPPYVAEIAAKAERAKEDLQLLFHRGRTWECGAAPPLGIGDDGFTGFEADGDGCGYAIALPIRHAHGFGEVHWS
jgi:hypothetical protein